MCHIHEVVYIQPIPGGMHSADSHWYILARLMTKGKRDRLETVLTIIVLAKLCGCDRPMEIAEWAKNHQEQIIKLLQLKRPKLPHYD